MTASLCRRQLLRGRKGRLGLKVQRDQPAPRDRKGRKASRAERVQLVPRVQLAQPALKVQRGRQDHKAT